MNSKISVITVCYNSAKTIEKTILSVCNQTYKNFEYIIIDGKSSDGTLGIIAHYQKQYPEQITYISEKDNGIYDAMNKGIAMAKGDLIALLNSDDYYEEDALEIINQYYDGGKYQILYGIQKNFERNEEFTSVRFIHHMYLDKDMITHPTCFVSKAVYQDYGCYDLEYKSASDYEFMLRIKHNHPEVKFIPIFKVITNFSMGGMSSSVVGKIETHKIKYKYHIISGPYMVAWNFLTYLKSFWNKIRTKLIRKK